MRLTMFTNINRAFDMWNKNENLPVQQLKSCIRDFLSFDFKCLDAQN